MNKSKIIYSLLIVNLAIMNISYAKDKKNLVDNITNKQEFVEKMQESRNDSVNAFKNGGSQYGISIPSKTIQDVDTYSGSQPMGVNITNNSNMKKTKKIKRSSSNSNTMSFSSDSNLDFGINQPKEKIDTYTTSINGQTIYNTPNGNSAPIGLDFTNKPPKTNDADDAKLINYRACLRVLINNGKSVSEIEKICHRKNPGVVDSGDKIPESNDKFVESKVPFVAPTEPKKQNNNLRVSSGSIGKEKNKDYIAPNSIKQPIGDKGAIGIMGKGSFIAPAQKSFVGPSKSAFIAPSPDGGGSFVAPYNYNGGESSADSSPNYVGATGGSECDVSRDIRVLFSSKCLNKADNTINQNMGISPLSPIAMENLKPINIQTPKTQMPIRPATPKNAFTCDYNFTPEDKTQKSKQGTFHPHAAIDCLKRALAFSYNQYGEVDIVMTTENGNVSTAKCTISKSGKNCSN